MNIGSVDDLQWSMRRLSWQNFVLRSLVKKLPGVQAVEAANPRACQNLGLHQARIHTHPVARADRSPMGHGSANLAAVELNLLRSSHIRVGYSVWNNYIFGRVVGPQRAVAPTQLAIAIRHFVRSASNRKADCSANTGRLDQSYSSLN